VGGSCWFAAVGTLVVIVVGDREPTEDDGKDDFKELDPDFVGVKVRGRAVGFRVVGITVGEDEGRFELRRVGLMVGRKVALIDLVGMVVGDDDGIFALILLS